MTIVRRITQKELALAAGVSQMTISLALRDHVSVAEPTRQRIRRVAAEMGYAPDPALSALVAYRRTVRPAAFHGTLGWLSAASHADAHESWPETIDFFAGATERAATSGFKIEPVWLREPGMSTTRVMQIVVSRGIRGVILPPQTNASWDLGGLQLDSLSVIRLGDYTTLSTGFNLVATDHFAAAQEAISRTMERGYHRIGYVSSPLFEKRLNYSYTSAILGYRSLVHDCTVVPPLELKPDIWPCFKAWYKRWKPDALIVPNNQDVLPLVKGLAPKMGLRVPADLGLCFTCLPSALKGNFSGIDEGYRRVGSRAVDYLIDMINRNEVGLSEAPTRHLLLGQWVDGETLPPRTGRKRVSPAKRSA